MIFIVYKCDECGEFEYEIVNEGLKCLHCFEVEPIPGPGEDL